MRSGSGRHAPVGAARAALHGLTVLRSSKRGFPWPPVEALVDGLLDEFGLTSQ
jgi:hypothetical protein